MGDFLFQINEITQNFPDADISVKIGAWYNWLYSQLDEYETYVVCPPTGGEFDNAADALAALDKFEISEVLDALPGYLAGRLILEGRRFAQRAARQLFRRVIRRIILRT